jgi:hypothetical protein
LTEVNRADKMVIHFVVWFWRNILGENEAPKREENAR